MISLMKNRIRNNSLFNKMIMGIVIFFGLSGILVLNINNSTINLERIDFQTQLVTTLGSYEKFQDETQILIKFRTDIEIYKNWIKAKETFVNNFNLTLELDNFSDIYEDRYKQILVSIERETKIVEWNIADILQEDSGIPVSEFSKVRNRQVDIAINNLNILLSESLKTNMKQLYSLMSEYQRVSFIRRSRITTITSILLVLIMIIILNTTIKSYRIKELEYLDKSNKTLDVTIKIMAYQVELRDSLTSKHLERTSKYVNIIAKELSKNEKYKYWINENYIKDLEKASVLHDIGKIAIPDRILHKKGKLTFEEFEEVKKHCQYGGDTLRLAKKELPFESFLDLAIKLTESHHEHWNGNGYPNKLSGDDIPLSGRIMSIADVYDALRSKRVYKDKMSHSICLDYIKKRRGTQFDPAIVDAFLAIADKIEKISKKR